MTLPVFIGDELLPAIGDVNEGQCAVLSGTEGRHGATVRRMSAGERLDIVNGAGRRLTCTISDVREQSLEVIVDQITDEGAPSFPLYLIQALAKGGRDEQAVETATEVGMDHVIPWQANRSIVKWSGNKAAKGHAKWEQIVRSASKQSRRAFIPRVHDLLTSQTIVGWVNDFIASGGIVFMCHESAQISLLHTVTSLDSHNELMSTSTGRGIAVVVGPEGGIDDGELRVLTQQGAQPVLLGPHVLRSSTAGPVALTLLCALTKRW